MFHPTYDIEKTYDENYNNGPTFYLKLPKNKLYDNDIKIWGYNINSIIGIPAGPLLNSLFIKLYSSLGFDCLVYKTVRSIERNAYLSPNCLIINNKKALSSNDIGKKLYIDSYNKNVNNISITNSFGMPSKSIEIWQNDIEKAYHAIAKNQLMIISCVGTLNKDRNFIDDFVYCAKKAIEAGAKAIELNYSCPNVLSKEGNIYQDPLLSSHISKKVRTAIKKDIPIMIKIGYIDNESQILEILKANAPFIDGVAAINTISMQVCNKNGIQALPGKGRLRTGICGKIIKNLAIKMIKSIYKIRKKNNFDFIICGVGGVINTNDIDEFLDIGCDIVMSATGAMWNPLLAYQWKNKKTTL